MIVAYAGRRAESLPTDAEDVVATRVRRLITALAPSAVVGPAADGGDLIVLEAALKRPDPPVVHIVLPTSLAEFRAASVEESWRARHDRVLQRVPQVGGAVESLGLPDGEDAYRKANTRVLDKALSLARNHERVVALVLATPGEGAMVADFIERAELQGISVLRIDPAVDLNSRPHCFIAMPFGTKYDPQRKLTLDCNLLYDKVVVPALEHAQLRFRRADEQIDSGVVLQPMIEALSEADLVIGDLATGNFNVGWELGLRHLLRARHTVLMLPKGVNAPFDLASLRHVDYEHGEGGISDDAAIAAWQALGPYLQSCERPVAVGSDSPVEAVMQIEQWAVVHSRRVRDETWESLRERLALARDLRDVDLTLAIVREASTLAPDTQQLIAAEAGVELVRLGAYADGEELLRELVEADTEVLRPAAHVFYAQSLYRPAAATINAFDRAEEVLRSLLIRRPEYPEVWAGLGAINKRRSHRRENDELRRNDIEGAMEAYAHDYERNLDAYYEGINFVACGVLLEVSFEDQEAGDRARRALPAVRLAAELAWQRNPADFWAAVTVAEAGLYDALLDGDTTAPQAIELYRAAGALRPGMGSVDSSLTRLEWLAQQGVTDSWINEAGRELAMAAGFSDLADRL